ATLDLFGEVAQSVKIFTVDLQCNLRTHTRQHMVEPMRDRLPYVDGDRQHRQPRSDVCDDFLLAAVRALEVDVDLRRVDALSVLVELRPSGSATNCPYLGNLQYEAFGDETHAVGFGERDTGPQKHGDGERPLVEGGQERAREQRRAPDGEHDR